MIKLFTSDLDGTLLARSHQFDELIKVTVEKIVSENAFFTISTGRDCSMTELNGLEDKIYRICMNGALIMSPEGETLKLDLIDKDILKILLEEFDDLDLEFITPYKTYTKQSKEEFFEKWRECHIQMGMMLRLRSSLWKIFRNDWCLINRKKKFYLKMFVRSTRTYSLVNRIIVCIKLYMPF